MGSKDLFAFLFVFGVLLLNWPFLGIFKITLPYYLFGMWAGLIFLVLVIVSRSTKGDVF